MKTSMFNPWRKKCTKLVCKYCDKNDKLKWKFWEANYYFVWCTRCDVKYKQLKDAGKRKIDDEATKNI